MTENVSEAGGTSRGEKWISALGSSHINDRIKGFSVYFAIHTLFLFLVLGFTVVPDMNTGSTTGYIAVPHSVWGASSLLIVAAGAASVRFGAYFQMATLTRNLRLLSFFMVADIFAKVAHLALLVIELAQCKTALCLNTNSPAGFASIIFFIVANALVLAFLNPYFIKRVLDYQFELEEFLQLGYVPGMISSEKDADKIINEEYDRMVNTARRNGIFLTEENDSPVQMGTRMPTREKRKKRKKKYSQV